MRQQQECCVEPLMNDGYAAGAYKLFPNDAWDEPQVAIPEGSDAHGSSTFMLQGDPICSGYTLRSHRARVEPLCEGPRDSLEWVVVRDFIGNDGFACN
ncbi:MAG: hypothetical protein H6713_11445 [Myxococcales bacterium]|nr:hypothetical protein [Myxococcales bacterium]